MAEKRQQANGGRPREEVVGADDPASPNVRGEEATLAISGFRLIERALLIIGR